MAHQRYSSGRQNPASTIPPSLATGRKAAKGDDEPIAMAQLLARKLDHRLEPVADSGRLTQFGSMRACAMLKVSVECRLTLPFGIPEFSGGIASRRIEMGSVVANRVVEGI
jgi:hypothetical protein